MEATVLISARTPRQRQALESFARTTGLCHNTVHADNEQSLLRLLDEVPVDLILHYLPARQRNGLAWLADLSKREQWRDIPTTIVTASHDCESRVSALEQGASDAFHQHTGPREAGARLRRLLRQRSELRRLKKNREELALMALTDSLTGLCNRAYFDITLQSEAARAGRTGLPYTLLLIDIDHFKSINDSLGHQQGDRILQVVARVLQTSVRRSDFACRYGGEEFAIILPETDLRNAHILARRIHEGIAALNADLPSLPQPLTVSIGISCALADSTAPQRLVEQADCALYAAKRNGRNRTEIFQLRPVALDQREPIVTLRPASNLAM